MTRFFFQHAVKSKVVHFSAFTTDDDDDGDDGRHCVSDVVTDLTRSA